MTRHLKGARRRRANARASLEIKRLEAKRRGAKFKDFAPRLFFQKRDVRAAAHASRPLVADVGARKESAGEEDYAEQNVYDVIHRAEVQAEARERLEHSVGAVAEQEAADAEQPVYDAEDDAEEARGRERSGEAEVERYRARDEMDEVVCQAQMRAEEAGRDEAYQPDQNEHDAKNLTDGFRHDFRYSSLGRKGGGRAAL